MVSWRQIVLGWYEGREGWAQATEDLGYPKALALPLTIFRLLFAHLMQPAVFVYLVFYYSKHNVIVAGTRDCTLQRRFQKLVEEAPAPFLTDDQRKRIHDSADTALVLNQLPNPGGRVISVSDAAKGEAETERLVEGDEM